MKNLLSKITGSPKIKNRVKEFEDNLRQFQKAKELIKETQWHENSIGPIIKLIDNNIKSCKQIINIERNK